MKVVAIRKVNFGKIKAMADVETSEGIIIKGFKVAEGPTGLFVGMPSQKGSDGKYYDIVTINDRAVKDTISSLVLDAFENGIHN